MKTWINEYFEKNKTEILKEYFELLRFKTISAIENNPEMTKAIDWIYQYLKEIGFKVEIWQTKTYPTIFASFETSKESPTILIYNHYDVQPIDPIELWQHDPFDPTLIDGHVFCRGAQDNKGQLFFVLAALKALIRYQGILPVNVKLCIEGDEEIGSIGLNEEVLLKKAHLQADYLLIVDLSMKNEKEPAITLGTRGLLTFDLSLTSAHTDLHSGEHGGIVLNPIQELCHLLSKLHDEELGTIMIPGFYNGIYELTTKEKEKIDFSFDASQYEKLFGAKPCGGEINFIPRERSWMRPTFEINGIWGGFTSEGFKTVLPKSAFAKISCRLIKGQNPLIIKGLISEFLQKNTRKELKLHIQFHASSKAQFTSPQSKGVKIVAKAMEEVMENECKFIFAGGTIGIIEPLQEASNAEVILFGLGLPTDNIHAPNEKFSVDRINKGIQIIATILSNFQKEKP